MPKTMGYPSASALFLDGTPVAGERVTHFAISENAPVPATVTCQPRGGFVIVLADD
jgi:hypothetical protein